MLRPVRRLLSLPLIEDWLLFQALIGLPLAAAGVRLLGLKRVLSLLARLPTRGTSDTRAARARYLLGVAATHGLYRGNCLSQSLTLLWLLRSQGLTGELRIGVRKEAGRLLAHAWVEHRGQPLNAGPQIYRIFPPFDRAIVPAGVRWS